MAIDDFIKITASISGFLNTIAWPLVVLWLVRKFAPLLRDFLANITEGSVKAFGVEATAKRNATIELAKAELTQSIPQQENKTDIASKAENSIRSADAVTRNIQVQRLVGKSVLWIDDHPEHTFYERNALLQFGMNLELATDADDALPLLDSKSFDIVVIVTPNILPSSGAQKLVETVLARGIPYILYGEAKGEDPVTKAAAREAMAIVSRASELTLAVANNVGRLTGSDSMQSYVGFIDHIRAFARHAKR
jgi:PleD family two-component response regulator